MRIRLEVPGTIQPGNIYGLSFSMGMATHGPARLRGGPDPQGGPLGHWVQIPSADTGLGYTRDVPGIWLCTMNSRSAWRDYSASPPSAQSPIAPGDSPERADAGKKRVRSSSRVLRKLSSKRV